MNRKKVIYCPKCGHKVADYDGKSKINIEVKCRNANCKSFVVYDVENDETSITKEPLRATGSGLRFY